MTGHTCNAYRTEQDPTPDIAVRWSCSICGRVILTCPRSRREMSRMGDGPIARALMQTKATVRAMRARPPGKEGG